MPIFQLTDDLVFPPPELAEDGLLAVGGDLRPERLLLAYSMGIFPWYTEEEPLLWWSPDPRMIVIPEEAHISRRLQRVIRQGTFRVTVDETFGDVIRACASAPRPGQGGTWILDDMVEAYCALHEKGFAHSVECWQGETLVGGLYGVSLGRAFFGESMFSRVTDASKAAFAALVDLARAWNFSFIDCQMTTPHLERLGGKEVTRERFLKMLKHALTSTTRSGKWQ